MLAGAVLADPETMLARLSGLYHHSLITASVPAEPSSPRNRFADTIKGGELSYTALALQRERTAY